MKKKLTVYTGLAVVLLALYAAGEFLGWEAGGASHARVDPSVRQSPGGWRSWTFWHHGYRGGK